MTAVDINPIRGIQLQATYFPGNDALIYEDQKTTYAELLTEVREYAAALAASGVSRGDRVAYLGLNSKTFILTMVSSWWLGAVFEPFNFRLAPREVASLIGRSTPKVLIVEPCHQDVADAVVELEEFDASVTRLVLVDNDDVVPAPAEVPAHYARLTEFLAAGGEAPAPVEVEEDDLAMLMFTSGTTGLPKGVQLTHGNVWWNQINVDSLVDTRRGDVNLCVAPLFHIGGLNALTIRVLARGGVNLIRRAFDPRQTLKDIEQHGAAQAFLVPAMLSAMQQTDEFATVDISSMRALICAGAPVPPVLLKQYAEKNVNVQQAWGLTETAPFATYLPHELTYQKPGSCGMPMPYTEVKIVDPATGDDVTEPGVTGEMWAKGPNVTIGYWQDAETTADAFTDGWFHTGDIGYVDEDGYFFIVDRLKDMIISGGENVYPAEVERALMEFPGVLDVAVVGQPDEKWGETVVAVMSFSEGTDPTIEDVREFAADYLARYKLPRRLIATGSVPRNGSGKLNKIAIRQMVQED